MGADDGQRVLRGERHLRVREVVGDKGVVLGVREHAGGHAEELRDGDRVAVRDVGHELREVCIQGELLRRDQLQDRSGGEALRDAGDSNVVVDRDGRLWIREVTGAVALDQGAALGIPDPDHEPRCARPVLGRVHDRVDRTDGGGVELLRARSRGRRGHRRSHRDARSPDHRGDEDDATKHLHAALPLLADASQQYKCCEARLAGRG